jgi:hypothetical protein
MRPGPDVASEIHRCLGRQVAGVVVLAITFAPDVTRTLSSGLASSSSLIGVASGGIKYHKLEVRELKFLWQYGVFSVAGLALAVPALLELREEKFEVIAQPVVNVDPPSRAVLIARIGCEARPLSKLARGGTVRYQWVGPGGATSDVLSIKVPRPRRSCRDDDSTSGRQMQTTRLSRERFDCAF